MVEKYFKEKYENLFGKELTKKLFNSKNEIKDKKYIRFNLSKISNIEFENFLKSKRVEFEKTFIKNVYEIKHTHFNLASTLNFLQGEFLYQDLASCIPINLIKFDELKKNYENKTFTILDMASSPGSKLSQLIDLLKVNKIKYQIDSYEIDHKRIQRLLNNLNKQKFLDKNIKIFNSNALEIVENKKFDLVLLDAPCSGNFILDEVWFEKRNRDGIIEKASIQKKLLKKANTLLEKNGILIYSTCTLENEENEENVLFCENKLKLNSIKINESDFPFKINGFFSKEFEKYNNLNSLRLFPFFSKTQSFFVSIFKK
jgi:16S rRNA C967 or C1407 C5-methylase (RsmB/RsmF family)